MQCYSHIIINYRWIYTGMHYIYTQVQFHGCNSNTRWLMLWFLSSSVPFSAQTWWLPSSVLAQKLVQSTKFLFCFCWFLKQKSQLIPTYDKMNTSFHASEKTKDPFEYVYSEKDIMSAIHQQSFFISHIHIILFIICIVLLFMLKESYKQEKNKTIWFIWMYDSFLIRARVMVYWLNLI